MRSALLPLYEILQHSGVSPILEIGPRTFWKDTELSHLKFAGNRHLPVESNRHHNKEQTHWSKAQC